MITCQPLWRWMRRFLHIGIFIALWAVSPAGAEGFPAVPRTSEPVALAVLGAGFFILSFIRRRYSGD
jgi:hypothetical protein